MSDDELEVAGGVEFPESMRIPTEWPKRMPENPVSRRIVTLAVLHSEVFPEMEPVRSDPSKLDGMSEEARAKILEDMNDRLNIRARAKLRPSIMRFY